MYASTAAALATPIPPVCRFPGLFRRLSPLSPLPCLHANTVDPGLSFSSSPMRQMPMAVSAKESIQNIDADVMDEYTSQAKLLQEFSNISNIDKAWVFRSDTENGSQAMFSIGQSNLLANTKKRLVLSSYISEERKQSVKFHWSPFPVEMIGVSIIVPSPSGSKLLVVRNKENGSPTHLEIWDHSKLEKEIHIPHSIHGSIFTDKWFEGISWNNKENLIAYVAEEKSPSKPTFNDSGFNKEGDADKDCGNWKCQGDWEEHWGETYVGKRKPALFVLNTESGEVRTVSGIPKSLSVGQVVWAPLSLYSSCRYLVFVGWKSENEEKKSSRKLGMKYCYNRPCALYAISYSFEESLSHTSGSSGANVTEDSTSVINLTPNLSSAFFPQFSPDGKSLVFLSAKSAVDSGAHSATNSLHRIDWQEGEISSSSSSICDVVPVVMCAKDGCFPGLYCPSILSNPWLSDGCTMVLCSFWGSMQVIISVNIFSCKISRVTPNDSFDSWTLLAMDGDNIIAATSNPVNPPKIKYGRAVICKEQRDPVAWDWLDVSSPLPGCSEKILSMLSSLQFNILKIPICDGPGNLTEGARKPIEAIFVSSSDSQIKEICKEYPNQKACNPLIVVLHGGPHSVSLTSYSKSTAFLAALGYNLLIVNYRGSLGFGEDALQSLPGKIGTQDVGDVLAALDYIIELKLADPSKIAILGGSHGGFLTTHLIGQASERFRVAAVRNPVCNLSLMVGTSDIPDWVYVEAYGPEGINSFTEAASMEHLIQFFTKSPISHLSKVKTPTLFLLGDQDLRVPVSNGLQYARALKEKGVEVKVIVFPKDTHAIDRPQSDFESFLNIGVWFKKYCK